MSDIYNGRRKNGYSEEDAWFHRQDRRAIEKLKSQKKRDRSHLKLVPQPDELEASTQPADGSTSQWDPRDRKAA